MPVMTGYEPGIPCWIDVGSADVPATVAFYTSLFGWTSFEPPGGGGYTMFLQGDKHVAAVGPLMMPGQPEQWSTYVSVADADTTAAAITSAGGTILAPPFDVMEEGRMAVCMDDGGAVFSLWQPKNTFGAELVNEPVSFCWTELASTDIERSKRFYAAVFGWGGETNPFGGGSYTEFKLGDRSFAGMQQIGEMVPAGTPPHWLVYLSVADTDATVQKATSLGATVTVPPMDIEVGRFSVLSDPRGAFFGIIRLKD
jgi:predicted enzyme related to lactoylglutathione lyase